MQKAVQCSLTPTSIYRNSNMQKLVFVMTLFMCMLH